MSKSSGSTRTQGPQGGLSGDFNVKSMSIRNVETLKNIQDKKLYNEIGAAISRYHSVLGVREQNIKLADMPKSIMGAQATLKGELDGIYLQKSYFKNATPNDIENDMRRMYQEGWQTRTNKPIAHVVTHELAHATWNTSLRSENARNATPEIISLFREWMRDKNKTGYGRYSTTNINEFWAETTTKAVHGTSDRYTTRVKEIIKKYNL